MNSKNIGIQQKTTENINNLSCLISQLSKKLGTIWLETCFNLKKKVGFCNKFDRSVIP